MVAKVSNPTPVKPPDKKTDVMDERSLRYKSPPVVNSVNVPTIPCIYTYNPFSRRTSVFYGKIIIKKSGLNYTIT